MPAPTENLRKLYISAKGRNVFHRFLALSSQQLLIWATASYKGHEENGRRKYTELSHVSLARDMRPEEG